MHAFASSKSVIKGLAQSHGFAGRLWEYRLQQQWKRLVGEAMASHTWPTRIKFHKLHVIVDNSVWLHQLTYLKPTLVEKIQAEMKDLTLEDIIFRIGEIPECPEEGAPGDTAQPHVSPDARMTARDYTQAVTDEELRDSLARVIAKALSSATPPQKRERSDK